MRQHSDNCGKTHGRVFSAKYLHRRSLAAAVALCAAVAALTASAADWTDANNATYTALKSIKGGGSAYIVTAITPAGTETVKLKFQPTVIATSGKGANEALFCSRISTADAAQFSGFKLANKIRIDRGGVHGTCATLLPAANSDYAIVADFANGTASINGTSTTFDNELGTEETDPYTPTQPLYLYASHASGNNIGYKGYFWLYYFQMYSSAGVLQHNFMPAVCDSNSVTGLYDTVQRKFYAPTGGSFANSTARTVTAPSGCKKWTGLGADNKMSTDANWEGGVAPQAGDNLDFTLAAPLAGIDADMSVTFGKVWIDDGDLPGFTGTLTATAINDLERMTAYDTATDGFAFTLDAPSGQDFTWNGGADANWNSIDASWLCNSAASVWYDNNNAIFNTADATATLTADATANSLTFNQNATVGGTATLTVPTVSVAADVSATISAPTAGALTKTGAGTLTLSQNRSAATTLAEGTLALYGAASLDWSTFTFGTDPAKPVRLDFGPTATLSGIGASAACKIGSVANVTSTVHKAGGNWTFHDFVLGNASGAVTTLHNEDGDLLSADYFYIGNDGAALSTLTVGGGTVGCTSPSSQRVFIGYFNESVLTVTNTGVFTVDKSLFVANRANGTVNISDGGRVVSGGDIVFGFRSATAIGIVNLGRGGVLEANSAYLYTAGGSATVNFDGGTFKWYGDTTFLLTASAVGEIFPPNGSVKAVDVTISANGGTIDNSGTVIRIPRTMTGVGGMTFAGAGTTLVSADQSYLGTTTVSNGTTLAVSGISLAGPLAFDAGAGLDVTNYAGVVAVSATSLMFPQSGTVALTLDGGAFPEGAYSICSATGVMATDGAKFAFTTADGLPSSWGVSGNTLVLTVGSVAGNTWTGGANDGRMSTGGNWLDGSAPVDGEDVDFSSVSSGLTIIADIANATFGAVTMGEGVITFTNSFAATSFSDTSKIAVGADSTVTINGDLVFSWPDKSAYPICNNVAAGGVFRVTGSIIADSENRGYIVPCPGSIAGTIAADGLVNNSSNSDDAFRLVRGTTGSSVNWEIGAAGISGTRRFVVSNASGSHATIKAATNFTISANIVQARNLTIDPKGWTVTIGNGNSDTSSGGGILRGDVNGMTTVTGSGKVVINYDAEKLTTTTTYKKNAFTVSGSATLAIMPGANVSTSSDANGALTVNSGATLEVAASGTAMLKCNLTLADGATLAFNFTDRRVAPQIAVASGKTLTANGAVKVKIPEGSLRPTGGEHVLTTCGGFDAENVTVSLAAGAPEWVRGLSVNADGNIVLDVKPMGTIVIFR